MARPLQAITTALMRGLLVAFSVASIAAAATNTGLGNSGAANFTCNTEVGLCECEGSKNGVDCKAMRRNCKDIDDIFSTDSPQDKGKFFCVMVKRHPAGATRGGAKVRGDAQPPSPAAATDSSAARRNKATPARAAVKRSDP